MTPGAQGGLLVVDDDHTLAGALEGLLGRQEYAVTVASTGKAALQALSATNPEVIVVDPDLPDGGGVEVLRAATNLPCPPEIIVAARNATPDSTLAAVEAEVAAYLLKPVDLARLDHLVRRFAARRRLRLTRTRQLSEQELRTRELYVLLGIAERLTSTLELEPLLKEISRRTAQALRADRCSVQLFVDGEMVPVMSQFADGHVDRELWKRFRALGGQVLAENRVHALAVARREAVAIDDVASSELAPAYWREMFGIRSALVVPLIRRDQVIGTLNIDMTRVPRHFTEQDLHLATTISSHLALAIDNARLYTESRTQARRMRRLADLSQLVTATLDYPQVLDRVAEAMLELLEGDVARVWVVDPTGQRLRMVASQARDPDDVADQGLTELPLGQSVVGWVVEHRMKRHSPDLSNEPLMSDRAWVARRGYVTQFAVPLPVGERAVGALAMFTKRPRRYTRDEEDLLEAFAAVAATALENARLYKETATQRTQLRQILDATTDGILFMRPGGRIEAANRRSAELIGADVEQLVGADLVTLLLPHIGPSERDPLFAASLRARFNEHGGDEGDLTLPGLGRVLHWMAQPTADSAGEVVGITVTLQDVSRERQVSQMKTDFVSFVTHQLRTPLSGIKWMLELAGDEKDAAAASSYVQDARGASERLIALVNNLLDIARLERGRLEVNLQPTDLGALTEQMVAEVQPLVQERQHRLSVSLPAAVPRVSVDPELMRQVLLNLLSNAIKYTRSGGDIAVALYAQPDALRWSVRDSGIGIPKDARRRLFEKFFRADNVVTLETEGTGLGLYLVRLLIERFGGRVWCESEEGSGSTFQFILPLLESR